MSGQKIRFIIFSLIIVIVLAGVSALQYFNIQLISLDSQQSDTTSIAHAAMQLTVPDSIEVHHSVSGGVNSYSGSISIPMCDSLSTGIQTIGNNPPEITLMLSTTIDADCDSTDSDLQNFSVSASSQGAPQFGGILLNGDTIPTTIVED